jgi:Domain of unknown function (DUF4760)
LSASGFLDAVDTYERWSLVGTYASIVIGVVAFGVLAWQVRLLAQQIRQAQVSVDLDHDRRRKQATLDAYQMFLNRQAELRQRGLPSDYHSERVKQLIHQALDGDTVAFEVIGEYLNMYEVLATSVRYDVLHLPLIDRGMGRRIVIAAQLYRPFTEHLREMSGNPDVFGDFDWLAAKIRERRGPDLAAPQFLTGANVASEAIIPS